MRLPRLLPYVLVLTLAISTNAFAGSRTTRSDEKQYNYTSGSVDPSGTDGKLSLGVVHFSTTSTESSIRVFISDLSGLPVRALLAQDFDDDGAIDYEEEFCGRSKGAIPIRGGVDVSVYLLDGPCSDGTLGMATSGSIKARFRR
jgi:hypothetical protein